MKKLILYLIIRYGFPNLPLLPYLEPRLLDFRKISPPPTIWTPRLLGNKEYTIFIYEPRMFT